MSENLGCEGRVERKELGFEEVAGTKIRGEREENGAACEGGVERSELGFDE